MIMFRIVNKSGIANGTKVYQDDVEIADISRLSIQPLEVDSLVLVTIEVLCDDIDMSCDDVTVVNIGPKERLLEKIQDKYKSLKAAGRTEEAEAAKRVYVECRHVLESLGGE